MIHGAVLGLGSEENGALMIVTWCAIMLHARGAEWLQPIGFAVMAVFEMS